MQNLAKRQWGPALTIREARDIMIDWCVRAREKNVLRKKPPQLFYSYVLDDTPPLQYFHNVSSVFKYSQKDVPYIDQSRDALLRCLGVALKAHFFLFPDTRVAHEPYFFTLPSFDEPTNTTFGLIYKIERENKVIVVCEKPLNTMYEKSKILFEFPVVLTEDSFKWYHTKNWGIIKQQANLDNSSGKPWINKKLAQDAKDAATKEELIKFATPLEVPYDIKDAIKPLGIEWSNKVKTWYLPKGFDVDSVNEYLEYTKRQNALLPKVTKENNYNDKKKD